MDGGRWFDRGGCGSLRIIVAMETQVHFARLKGIGFFATGPGRARRRFSHSPDLQSTGKQERN